MWIAPPPLQPGDAVAVIAPASWITPDDIAPGVTLLEAHGFRVRQRPDLFAQQGYLAGDDARRAAELQQWLADPQVTAIVCGRGGYGCQRLIPHLNAAALTQPKWLVGYSDITILQGWLARTAGWQSIYGPTLRRHLAPTAPQENWRHLHALLTSSQVPDIPAATLRVIKPGHATGRLTGGCLSLLHAALGTSYAWPLEGILFLEDIGEKLYALDRMLTHLQHAGALARVTGIVFGGLSLHVDEPTPDALDDILRDVLRDFAGPVVAGIPAGHQDPFYALPLGRNATLETLPAHLQFHE